MKNEAAERSERHFRKAWRRFLSRFDAWYRSAEPHRLTWKEFVSAVFIGGFFFFLYLYTCSHGPNITGDSPELIGASYSLGVPHPPGYPLYVLLGRLFTLLPVGSIAFRVNLSSVVYHSLALFFFFLVAFKVSGSRPAAAVATAALGISPLYWYHSLFAEVFPLNDLFAVVVLFTAIVVRDRWQEGRESGALRLAVLLAFLCGLSLCNHHSMVLLFPTLAIFALYPLLSSPKRWRYLSASAAAFLLGLLPYIYLPISASSRPYINFQDPSSLSGLFRVITRQYYGTTRLWIGPEAYHRLDVFFHFTKTLGSQLGLFGTALGLFGMFQLSRKRSSDFTPLFTGFLLTGLLFTLMANVRIISSSQISTLRRFYLLPFIFFFLFTAPAVGAVIGWAREKVSRLEPRLVTANAVSLTVALLLALPFLLPARMTSEEVSLRYDPLGQKYIENLLASVEEGSVVILQGDVPIHLSEYYKTCHEETKKVYFLEEPFLIFDWYAKTVKEWYPELDYPDPRKLPISRSDSTDTIRYLCIKHIIEHNPQVPGFYINYDPLYLMDRYRLVPWGITYRILPRDEDLDYASYYRGQWRCWEDFDFSGFVPSFYTVEQREMRTLFLISHFPYRMGAILEENGLYEEAARCYLLAHHIYPLSSSVEKAGLVYLRLERPDRAYPYLRKALSLRYSEGASARSRLSALLEVEDALYRKSSLGQ